MMSQPETQAWTVIGQNPRPMARPPKNPAALVDVVVNGEWRATVMLQHLKQSGLIMRLPMAAEGGPGLKVPLALWQAMADAALEAVKEAPDLHAALIGPHPVTGAQRRRVVVRPEPPPWRGP